MKTILILAGCLALAVGAGAQAPPGTISRSPSATGLDTNQPAFGNLSFTNGAGTQFSADQLAGQLRQLRATIDQTLPVLSAFNESYSNASPSLTSSISGLLSGVLNRGSNTNAPSQGTSSTVSNLVAGVQRLLTTNSTGTASVNADTVRELSKLQSQLQAVDTTLRNLNLAGTMTNSNGTYNGPLTPTGR